MNKQKNKKKDGSSWIRISIIAILSFLLLLLIIVTLLIVLGNLKIIYWPNTLNTVFFSIIIPDLGVIIALAQWLHTLSSDRKEEKNNLPEIKSQHLKQSATFHPEIELSLSERPKIKDPELGRNIIQPNQVVQVDMGEAPDVEHFYGREKELTILKRWIFEEHCRLVSIIGMGGIGKTTLAAKLIDQDPHAFNVIFWRSLLNAPPLKHILQQCLQFLTSTNQIEIPQSIEEQMRLLVEQLRQRRCLLILDNAEAVLKSGSSTAEYKDGYEEYGNLIRLLGETKHQSCLVVTSREQLREITWLEGEGTSVHSYRLGGLNVKDARLMLEIKGLAGEENAWKTLVEHFSGNPMMLTLISPTIRESYSGFISQYLVDFGDIPLNEYPNLRALLDRQFERLSTFEQQVFYWLAIEREAISLQDLRDNFAQRVSKMEMLTAIESLQRRSWVEQSGSGRFTLQPAMMDAVIDRFNELIVQEIITGKSEIFASHALIKAQTKSYIRDSQFQLILNVIAQKLFIILGREKLKAKFLQRLAELRSFPEEIKSYEAGNILNFLAQTNYDLCGLDFSGLVIWQAYLPEVNLPEVNFTNANLETSIFTDTFGSILCVSLSRYGDLLVAGMATGEIRGWYLVNDFPLPIFQGHTDSVRSVAISPDGKFFASGSEDQTIRLWEVSNGQCLAILRGHTEEVWSVAFSPDGKTLISGCWDQTVKLWEVSSGQCLMTLYGHSHQIRSIAISPDGKILASGSEDQTVRLWDVNKGTCLMILYGHTKEVWSVAFSPDGKKLASGSSDQTVRLWDVGTGECMMILHGHKDWIHTVAFSPDGKMLASGSEDQKVYLWDASNGQCLKTLQGHNHRIWSVAFSTDGKILASGSDDQTVRLWDVSNGQCFRTFQGYTNRIHTIAFGSDGSTLASAGEDQTVQLWDASNGQCLKTLYGHRHWIRSVAFSPDGKMLASGSEDQTVRLWDTSNGQCLKILQGPNHWVYAVAFSPDGKVLASGNEDRLIRLWDVDSGQCLKTLQGHSHWIWSVVFSPDGKVLASSGGDQTVWLWDVDSGQCLKTLQGHSHWVWSVAFSLDGKVLASGSEDQTVRLWDVDSGQCFKILQGHTGSIRSVAFKPDGRILASGSNDQTVRLWEIASGQCLDVLQGHGHWVKSVNFSPNGKVLASGGFDGAINVWDLQNSKLLHTLRSDRPYERMNITQVRGLTETQKTTLKLLGAIEYEA